MLWKGLMTRVSSRAKGILAGSDPGTGVMSDQGILDSVHKSPVYEFEGGSVVYGQDANSYCMHHTHGRDTPIVFVE